MLEKNCEKILSILKPQDLVLDVGGWACPFNRANYVLDMEPFETRGFYRTFGGKAFQGPATESFSKASWFTRDICAREPWPFHDKQFDFAICSHTLEDIRDPIGVCQELMRVSKRGYIEVPSVDSELSRGREKPRMPGLSHHRWLVTQNENKLDFVQKYQFMHHHWRFSFPRSYGDSLNEDKRVLTFFWEDRFEANEIVIHGPDNQENQIQNMIQTIRPYSSISLGVDRWLRQAGSLSARITSKCQRVLRLK